MLGVSSFFLFCLLGQGLSLNPEFTQAGCQASSRGTFVSAAWSWYYIRMSSCLAFQEGARALNQDLHLENANT